MIAPEVRVIIYSSHPADKAGGAMLEADLREYAVHRSEEADGRSGTLTSSRKADALGGRPA
jgi:hypothetical protein